MSHHLPLPTYVGSPYPTWRLIVLKIDLLISGIDSRFAVSISREIRHSRRPRNHLRARSQLARARQPRPQTNSQRGRGDQPTGGRGGLRRQEVWEASPRWNKLWGKCVFGCWLGHHKMSFYYPQSMNGAGRKYRYFLLLYGLLDGLTILSLRGEWVQITDSVPPNEPLL